MTPREFKLTVKNVNHWKRRVDKLEARETLTEDEKEELGMRKAQLMIWAYQLKHASPGGEDDPGEMSASSATVTAEKAGASA